jgi:predicted ATPase
MMVGDPLKTQRDASLAVAAELFAAGFDDVEEIGRGGFGIVFRGRQPALDRTVAVKVLTAPVDDDRERFVREQRAMGRLTGHPNIVGVLHVGETTSGYPYLVMQYHRQDSLDARIRGHGPLPLEEALRLGVKLAGALETAHRLGVLHRDVKPGNILFTDYGEPALTDFGIAHVSGGFHTAVGVVTGSPAFIAPEILGGDPPGTASDVYGLGATLFCALTGHAAFERRSGEQVVAQFMRIATESPSDLRDSAIADDVAAAVERAMSRDPRDRPSVLALGHELQQVQRNHGFPVDQMAVRSQGEDQGAGRLPVESTGSRDTVGNLPLELTSFIGRGAELQKVMSLLSTSRLVTVTGTGGVGKTRLALRAASDIRKDFPDGVWLVELGELLDPALLVDVVAAAVSLRDQSGRRLQDVLTDFLSRGKALLVLDNCEHIIDAVAKLSATLLRVCQDLSILATTREPLGIGGESLLALSPLSFPDEQSGQSLGGLPSYDAVALFVERAAAAVPGFELTEQNSDAVAGICARLDGFPLAIELAAVRMKVMSPEQILRRLSDRYTLLNRGARGAPQRQLSMELSIGWSYELCTPTEQRLWARLSVFAGSFDIDAAEYVCADDLGSGELVDMLSPLVDKSIVVRTETDGAVRFKLLQILRAFGRDKIDDISEYAALRRQHRDWYHRLVTDAHAEWFGPRQLWWIGRLERELPNLREALDFSLSERDGCALRIAAALLPFWMSRGLLSEGRRLLDRALVDGPAQPSAARIKALYAATMLAAWQADLAAATPMIAEARALVEQVADPGLRALVATADGFTALLAGELDRGLTAVREAAQARVGLFHRADALLLLGWAHEVRGDVRGALSVYEEVLTLAESHQESVYRANALWSIGIARWRLGEHGEAARRLRQALRLAGTMNDRRAAAPCLDPLAWMAMDQNDVWYAVVLMTAAEKLGRSVGYELMGYTDLLSHHQQCVERAREALGEEQFDAARREGASLGLREAVAYALKE